MVIQTAARHADREGREKMIELGSQRDTRQAPESAVLEGTVLSARQWRALGRRRNAVLVGIGLAAAAHVLRNYRFDERLILLAPSCAGRFPAVTARLSLTAIVS